MFVPSDGIYQAALAQDPALIEYGVQQQVLMATPTTLIGLLWAVHYGWRQELIAESAREIAESARELHSRLGRFVEPFAKVGRQLDSAVGAYNEAVGSFDAPRDAAGAQDRAGGRGLRTRGADAGRGRDHRAGDHRAARAGGAQESLAPHASRSLTSIAGAPTDLRRRLSTTSDQRERHRHRRRQLVDGEEQQVERQRQRRPCSAAARSCCERPTAAASSAPERTRDEQVAVAHHRRAEHRALQLRQAGRRVGGVQRVVGPLQQIGDDERRVGERHRDDPRRQPARRRDRRKQRRRARRS